MRWRESFAFGLTKSGIRADALAPRAYGRNAWASKWEGSAICEKMYQTRASQKRRPSKVSGS